MFLYKILESKCITNYQIKYVQKSAKPFWITKTLPFLLLLCTNSFFFFVKGETQIYLILKNEKWYVLESGNSEKAYKTISNMPFNRLHSKLGKNLWICIFQFYKG